MKRYKAFAEDVELAQKLLGKTIEIYTDRAKSEKFKEAWLTAIGRVTGSMLPDYNQLRRKHEMIGLVVHYMIMESYSCDLDAANLKDE